MSSRPPARANRGFQASYARLDPAAPELGEIGILPWDSEIFGFAVADHRLPAPAKLAGQVERFRRALDSWTSAHEVELVGCRIPQGAGRETAPLAVSGFRLVESQVRATRVHGSDMGLPPSRLTVRNAEGLDTDAIVRIAGTAFAFGRYHADPLFPRALADRRFRVWMERILAEPAEGTWIGVVGPPGRPAGFLHAEIGPEAADVRLMATDPETGVLAGPELLAGALRVFAARGVRRATAQISAANAAALNLYASLGFRFHDAELVFHWSRPGALHRTSPSEPA